MQTEKIRFFNTFGHEKQQFLPIEVKHVKMYTCGPTVHDFIHIGNLRAFLFEDLVRRWLEYRGLKVTQVMNITDVEDRIIRKSKDQRVSLKTYTERYINAFFEDIAALNIEAAAYYPRASEHIPEMVALVKRLLDRGYAYTGDDGSIYFDITKFKEYGKLSGVRVEDLKAGARVKVDDYSKEEAFDFALWKAWDKEDGDVFWQTELGKGRPGWHIECSAMSMKYLGETFDIHCGGVDNLFPHHENEIAQSESATGKKFVNYWLHNEHLLVDGTKMAKRLHNYYTLRDLTDKGHDPRAIRYLMISTHYRQQINFTFEGLDAATKTLTRLTNFMHRLRDADGQGCGDTLMHLVGGVERNFEEAMDDDLNVSLALASIFDFIREINNLLDSNSLSRDEGQQVYALMLRFDTVLGVIGEAAKDEELPTEAEELIRKREVARKAKDWKTADLIREQLIEMGINIEDTAHGVKWRLAKR